jgi:hypothetical protein
LPMAATSSFFVMSERPGTSAFCASSYNSSFDSCSRSAMEG